MNGVILEFRENISHVRQLGGIHQVISHLITSAVDSSDVLRSQHVLVVSALDCYVHNLTRMGMLEVFDGRRPSTPSYLRFRVSMDTVSSVASKADMRANFEAEIRSQHSYLSFQHPDKIADAVRLFSDVSLWERVAFSLGSTPTATKERLRLIVDRRNKIAHEADRDPSFPGVRWPIHAADVDGTISFIADLCEAIHTNVS